MNPNVYVQRKRNKSTKKGKTPNGLPLSFHIHLLAIRQHSYHSFLHLHCRSYTNHLVSRQDNTPPLYLIGLLPINHYFLSLPSPQYTCKIYTSTVVAYLLFYAYWSMVHAQFFTLNASHILLNAPSIPLLEP